MLSAAGAALIAGVAGSWIAAGLAYAAGVVSRLLIPNFAAPLQLEEAYWSRMLAIEFP